MQGIKALRKLYRPYQPTVGPSNTKVTYREFATSESLRDYIYCYWELKTTEQLASPFHYKVVADGCIDIFFDLRKAEDSFVMGFCKKYTEFPLSHSFHYVGIRFLPSIFTQLFKIDAKSLSDRYEHLKNLVPSAADYLQKNFHGNLMIEQIQSLFNEFFEQWVTSVEFEYDHRIYDALVEILKSKGTLNVETDLNTGLSPRQLRRLFNYYLGTTAKSFCKVVRFQHILSAKPSKQSLRNNKIFFDVGYYDQAHFVKEFKNFYGVTPSKAFSDVLIS